MPTSIQILAQRLEELLPELKRTRTSSAIANDMYEAAHDWHGAVRLILTNDTRANFQARAFSERCLLDTLHGFLRNKSVEDQQRYARLLELGKEVIESLEAVPRIQDGHLGVLRILRQHFNFLIEDYGFTIVSEKPTGLCFSSGQVFLELECASTSSQSCAFGPEDMPRKRFWIEDLLHFQGDKIYKSIPYTLSLQTERDVDSWFQYLAGLLKQYGREVLLNEPGVFDKLANVQAVRDEEIAREHESA